MKKYFLFLVGLFITYNLSAQTYSELVDSSASAIEKKNYVLAETTLKKALAKEPANPGNVMLLTNLGTIQRFLKKYDDALISYGAVLAKYPDNVTLLQSRAGLYCEMEKWNEALLDYNHIIGVDNKNYEAYQQRALIQIQNKHYLEASSDYAKLSELNPTKIDGKMGLALIAKRQQHWAEAEEMYTDLVYRHRENVEVYVNRAECYINLGKLARAKQDIDKAIELHYNDPYIYFLRGQLKMKQYDYPSAIEDFEKAKASGFDTVAVDEYIKLAKKK